MIPSSWPLLPRLVIGLLLVAFGTSLLAWRRDLSHAGLQWWPRWRNGKPLLFSSTRAVVTYQLVGVILTGCFFILAGIMCVVWAP